MGTTEHLEFASGLIDEISREAGAARVADRLRAYCVAIEAVLSPIVGRRGVAALMQRSLHLASAAHPWLSAQDEGLATSFDVAALTAAVLGQEHSVGLVGAVSWISTFHELLLSLIGASLTERLLRPILIGPTGAPRASRRRE